MLTSDVKLVFQQLSEINSNLNRIADALESILPSASGKVVKNEKSPVVIDDSDFEEDESRISVLDMLPTDTDLDELERKDAERHDMRISSRPNGYTIQGF